MPAAAFGLAQAWGSASRFCQKNPRPGGLGTVNHLRGPRSLTVAPLAIRAARASSHRSPARRSARPRSPRSTVTQPVRGSPCCRRPRTSGGVWQRRTTRRRGKPPSSSSLEREQGRQRQRLAAQQSEAEGAS